MARLSRTAKLQLLPHPGLDNWFAKHPNYIVNTPNVIRTHDPRLRRPLLYPAELWKQNPGEWNRTTSYTGMSHAF